MKINRSRLFCIDGLGPAKLDEAAPGGGEVVVAAVDDYFAITTSSTLHQHGRASCPSVFASSAPLRVASFVVRPAAFASSAPFDSLVSQTPTPMLQ